MMPVPVSALVDTHAHLCDPRFDDDRDAVLERARHAGVGAIIAVGEDLADARRNLELADRHPLLKPAAGLYPTYPDPDQASEMAAFIRSQRDQLVAVGEVGLDYWAVSEAPQKERQRDIFKQFIALSNELHLPLNVHSRSAGRHAVKLLQEHNAEQVQMHAFDGKAGAALPGVEAGYFFSIPPSVIRSRQKQKLVNLNFARIGGLQSQGAKGDIAHFQCAKVHRSRLPRTLGNVGSGVLRCARRVKIKKIQWLSSLFTCLVCGITT